MKKILLAGMLVLPTLMSASVWADKITDQINDGLKAYEEKDYKVAIDELKFVTAQLQKLDAAENQKLLPPPLEGWTVKKTNNSGNQMMMSMMGGGASMKASYTKEKQQVDIEVVANSPLLAMMRVMMNNPSMMAGKEDTEPYRYKRIKGMKKTGKRETEITLSIAGQIMLKITGKRLEDDAILEQYLDTMDMKKLKASLL
jgi:hypothetical protein